MDISNRTTKALGEDVMKKLGALRFCIVGCGGTGANFSEILVRTGATQLTLIDGTLVDESNLNRVFGFTSADVGKPKVDVLKNRLDTILPGLKILTLHDSFREPENILEDHPIGQSVRDAVYNADFVFIGSDTNTSRLAIESLCRDKIGGMLLSCGVLVDQVSGIYEFECNWSPRTPIELANLEGYGPENASFASIVLEATSVAFTMLLSHLKHSKSSFKSYRRRYDANFKSVESVVDGNSNGNIRSH